MDSPPPREPPAIVEPAAPLPPVGEPAAAPAPAPAVVSPHPDRPNAVQLDLGLAVIGLAYERTFTRWFAVQLEAQIFGTWFGPMVDLPNFAGFGAQIRPSFFVTDDAPRGIYIAPYVRVDQVTKGDDLDHHSVGWSAGTFGGYSFLFGERVNLRIGAGVQYMSYVLDVNGERSAFKTFFPALDLVVGFVF